MLGNLLHGEEKSRFILLKDGMGCPGRHLLLNWIGSLGLRCDKIILVCIERPPDFFTDWVPLKVKEKLICIDAHGRTGRQGNDSCNIFDVLSSALSRLEGKAGVIIDSVTHLIMLKSAPVICSSLQKLASGTEILQLVTLLHKDCHDQYICNLIEFAASSVVDLEQATGSGQTCHIRHCRTTGKVYKVRESFKFDEFFYIQKIGPASANGNVDKAQHSDETQMQNDPAAELSFSLSLTDLEKEARNKVKLPFLKQNSVESDICNPSTSGRILYQPDEADDFDEEDPDDDLNI